MNCPSCTHALEAHMLGLYSVEECPNCKGIWFDRGELEKARDEAMPEAHWLEVDLWADQEKMRYTLGKRECPECQGYLAQIAYGHTGILVDYCIHGHGLWLDAGEFERILAALEDEVTSKKSGELLRAAIQEGKELVTHPGNFASEWRDLATVMRLIQYRVLAENPRLAEALVAFQQANPLK